MDFDTLLNLMVDKKASDLFITRGVPPSLKINGQIMPVGKVPLSANQALALVEGIMDEQQRREFRSHHELNFAISSERVGGARFRVSAFYQRNDAGMVLRRIETQIPTVEDLLLPPILNELVMTKRGIIFFVGARPWPHRLDRGSDRIRAPARGLHHHPARSGHRYRVL